MQFCELLQFTFRLMGVFMLLWSGDGTSSSCRIPLWSVRLYVTGHKRQGHPFINVHTEYVFLNLSSLFLSSGTHLRTRDETGSSNNNNKNPWLVSYFQSLGANLAFQEKGRYFACA